MNEKRICFSIKHIYSTVSESFRIAAQVRRIKTRPLNNRNLYRREFTGRKWRNKNIRARSRREYEPRVCNGWILRVAAKTIHIR